MQMIEVRVRNQDCVDGGQIAQAKTRSPQSLQNKNPLREVRINDKVFSTDLQKKA